MEASVWMRQGYVFLRLDETGKAIYFHHNGETTNGTLQIGIVTGLTESSYPSGTYYLLYENTTLTSAPFSTAGYTKSNTDNQTFTFGVSGFDIYVKYNGTEVVRFKEYRHMANGALALKSNSGYGFRNDIVHTTLSTASLLSDYTNHKINMVDWGIREDLRTTGSISAGSTSLTVANATGFRVRDFIIVEIGHEAGAGIRGTVGVGGVWPALSYATTAELKAATPAVNTFAWAQDTGKIYRYYNPGGYPPPGTLGWYGDRDDVLWSTSRYYACKAVPRSLHARITNIAGNTITLDTAATESATEANVYFDNQLAFNDLLQQTRPLISAIAWPRFTVTIPAGTFWFGGEISAPASDATSLLIQGAGQDRTFLASAKGMRAVRIRPAQWASGVTVQDLTVTGNYGLDQFGLGFYDTLTPIPGSAQVTQYDVDGFILTVNSVVGDVDEDTFTGDWFTSGGVFILGCDGSTIQRVTVNDVFIAGIGLQDLDGGLVRDCNIHLNTPGQSYTQWQYGMSGVTNCTVQDSAFTSVAVHPGWEFIWSTGCRFVRCISNNGIFSINSATVAMEDCIINVAADSDAPVVTATAGMVQVNANQGGGPALGTTTIDNLVIDMNYINADNDLIYGVVATYEIPELIMTGGSYSSPPYAAPSAIAGPVGINSQARAATITGFHCCGDMNPSTSYGNINVTDGVVRECIADSIVLGAGANGSDNTVPCPT